MRTIYFVTNRETRQQSQDRFIAYDLKKPLPHEWDEWSLDDKGIWLNNGIFSDFCRYSDCMIGGLKRFEMICQFIKISKRIIRNQQRFTFWTIYFFVD